MTVIDFDDQRTSRAELEQAITSRCQLAKRHFAKVGDTTYRKLLTPWDRDHEAINALLDERQGA